MSSQAGGQRKPGKTQMCSFFLKGHCQNGENCRFAHGQRELDASNGSRSVAPSAARAPSQTRPTSAAQHKTQMCSFFLKGHCQNSENCRFAHGQHELDTSNGARTVAPSAARAPSHTSNGARTVPPDAAGVTPLIPHQTSGARPKTRMCPFFQMGHCQSGRNCKLAHGAHDMDSYRPDAMAATPRSAAQGASTPNTPSTASAASWQSDNQGGRAEQRLPPVCQHGEDCTRADCWFHHPDGRKIDQDAMDVRVREAMAGLPKAKHTLNRLREARFGHQALEKKAKECVLQLRMESLEALTPQARRDKAAEAKVAAAKVDELSAQLACFDETCSQCIHRLLELSRSAESLGDIEEDGSQEARSSTGSQDSDADRLASINLLHQVKREVTRLQAALPALVARSELQQKLQRSRNLVVKGDTGSGKSTQLPQYLAEQANENSPRLVRRILCTQPRKVAAVSLAKRVAEEWAAGNAQFATVGGAVGYHVGGRCQQKRWTRIVYMTEEVLLQQLMRQGEALLQDVHAIILDEAHERTIRLDLLLGWLVHLQQTAPLNFHLVVTSATLDVNLFSRYLQSCPVVEIAGRMFPVQDVFDPAPDSVPVQTYLQQKVLELHKTTSVAEGDILAFLPAQQDVESSKDALEKMVRDTKFANCEVFALHGGQDPDEQAPVFQKLTNGKRKIIFATNVAETSVTIDGVRLVVDSGLEKQAVFDAKRNLSSLEEVPISKSSAKQRRGRAGRTAPGVCVRLYSEEDFEVRRATQLPEVLSKPVSLTLLTLLRMGLDPMSFRWLEAPDKEAEATAWRSLLFLDACDQSRRALTKFGRFAAELQIDPLWANILFTGYSRNQLRSAAELVGVMSVLGTLQRPARDEESRRQLNEAQADMFCPEGDVVTSVKAFRRWLALRDATAPAGEDEGAGEGEARKANRQQAQEFCRARWLRPKAFEMARTTAIDMFKQSCESLRVEDPESLKLAASATDQDLLRLILAGCFLNIGVQCRGSGSAQSALYQLIQSRGSEGATIVAAPFPGSSLVRAGGAPPRYVCYTHIMQTSRTFLHGVTLLSAQSDAELVNILVEHSPSFALEVAEALPKITSQQIQVPHFSSRMLMGTRARQFRLDVQDRFACTFFADLKQGLISCWCQPDCARDTERYLVSHREKLLQEDLNEVEEDTLGGQTRPVYGRGGALVDILFPGEILSVNVIGLPGTTPEADVRRSFERYGPVRAVSTSTMASSGDLFCQATYVDKTTAKRALECYGQQCRDLVKVVPGKVQQGQNSSAEMGFLTLTWDCPETMRSSEDADLNVIMADLRRLVRLVDTDPEMQTFFRQKPWGNSVQQKAGLKVIYPGGLEQLQRAYQAMPRLLQAWEPPAYLAGLGQIVQSMRCQLTYQAVVSVHKAVADHFRIACPDGAACRYSDCPKWHEGRRQMPCKYGDACTRWHGANACKFLHSYAWHQRPAPQGPENALQLAFKRCQERGIRITVITKGQTTSFRLQHDRIEQVQRSREEFLQAVACDIFVHPQKDLLFTKPGVARMMGKLNDKSIPGYLHWDKKTRSVRIFGQEEDKSRTKRILGELLKELQPFERRSFMLDRAKTNDWGRELEQAVKGLGPEHYNLNRKGCILDVWVRPEDAREVQALTGMLSSQGWERRVAPIVAEGTCCLCMCDFDDDTWQFQACRHRFCTACIRNALSDPDGAHFPIACPFTDQAGRCNSHLVWKDLVGVVNSDVLARIKNIALDTYVRERPHEAMYCPAPACNHILRPPSVHTGNESKEGGRVVFCELCAATYCVACSEVEKSPVPQHVGYTCEERRRLGNPDIKKHREFISDILTLKCPRCRHALYDYDGCAAVKCTCGCGFCAKCFKDCGQDAHSHTQRCQGPGIPGIAKVATGYHLATQEFDRLNLQVAEYRIREYLDAKVPSALRREVLKACKEDFQGRPGGSIRID